MTCIYTIQWDIVGYIETYRIKCGMYMLDFNVYPQSLCCCGYAVFMFSWKTSLGCSACEAEEGVE